jgi:tetrahydromethanopterin S-methyltransferase subunit F
MKTAQSPDEPRLEPSLRERIGHARHVVENVRDQTKVALRDNPYILPLAAGAMGLAVGVLLGSRLARFLVVSAAGSVIVDAVSDEVRRVAGKFLRDLEGRLDDAGAEAARTAHH